MSKRQAERGIRPRHIRTDAETDLDAWFAEHAEKATPRLARALAEDEASACEKRGDATRICEDSENHRPHDQRAASIDEPEVK